MTSFDRERWRGRLHVASRVLAVLGLALACGAFIFGPALWRAAYGLGLWP
jgi:type IV secretory pathway TrbD component